MVSTRTLVLLSLVFSDVIKFCDLRCCLDYSTGIFSIASFHCCVAFTLGDYLGTCVDVLLASTLVDAPFRAVYSVGVSSTGCLL